MTKTASLVEVKIDPEGLDARLGVPDNPVGLVVFAHGSGSGRLSPRNNRVAEALQHAGLATLLLDLLTPEEELDRTNVFNIQLLARRLIGACGWSAAQPQLRNLPLGYFGASTGAGAALLAAGLQGKAIGAVVSRGGRPDLAGCAALEKVTAPALFIVGSLDLPVIDMNRSAMSHMRATRELVIVPGATHLFEEPGTLNEVIDHATRWFTQYF